MSKSELSQELCHFLSDMEAELKKENEQAIRRRFVTTQFIRTALIIMIIFTIVNGFLLLTLSDNLSISLDRVDNMTEKFAGIADDMTTITGSVSTMNKEISHLPHIAKSMNLVTVDMGIISDEVHGIVGNVSSLNGSVSQVDYTMRYIDFRMNGVSTDMYGIGENVHTMARPVKWLNWMLPWE